MTPNHHRAPDHGAPISNTPHSARAFTAEDGSSLVEFALTLPMFMLVVTGVLYLGIVLFNFITLTEATQFSARQMMISRGQTTDPCALFISTFYNSPPPSPTAISPSPSASTARNTSRPPPAPPA